MADTPIIPDDEAKKLAKINKKIEEGLAFLREEAKIRQTINSSFDEYAKSVRELKAVQKDILLIDKNILKQKEKVAKLDKETDDYKVQKGILDLLERQNIEFKTRAGLLRDAAADANKGQLAFAKGAKKAADFFADLPNLIQKGLGEVRGLGLWDLDKSIKKSALSMGLVKDQAKGFSKNIQEAAKNTNMIGIGIKELAKMQSDYSTELGKAVQLDSESLEALGQIAAATSLGAEGTAKMAADMAQQGYSAKDTSEFVEKTMQDAHSMGLDATKVVGLVAKNIKLLNQYQFKGGIEGLEKMAQTVAKLGVDMRVTAGFADKIMDIEGAVDMSAQLQVMGGAFAKLADPFHLMYMARNDMAGLTEEIGEAAKASVTFNKQKGDFEVSAMEMQRLKIVAQQLNMSLDDLVTMGKNAKRSMVIKGQISVAVPDEETRDFITNTAQMEAKTGRATIMVKSDKKYLDALSANDIAELQTEAKRKQSLEEYAKNARTFDDAFTYAIDKLKTYLIPVINDLDDKLIPKLDEFMQSKRFQAFIGDLQNIAGVIGTVVKTVAGLIIDHPYATVGAIMAGKAATFIINGISWVANGIQLAKGFQLGMAGKSGIFDAFKGFFGKSPGKAGGAGAGAGDAGAGAGDVGGEVKGAAAGIGKRAIKFGGGALGGALAGGINSVDAFKEGKTGEGVGNVVGGIIGGALGTLADEFMGPFGTILGAELGSKAGGWLGGLFDSDSSNKGINDGIVQGGKITPIDSKDDLLAMKPDGPIAKTMNVGNSGGNVNEVKHTFGDLSINGQLIVTTPGGGGVGPDLLKDPTFIRSITLLVTNEVQKMNNGNKSKG